MRALPGREARSTVAEPAAAGRDAAARSQRERILRATGELVAKRGYHDVTVALIVKRAHVSFRTFYKHFAGKEECFLELFDRVVERTRRRVLEEQPHGEEVAWAERVAAALRTIFAEIVGNPMLARAVIVEAPTVGPAIAARYEAATRALAPLLREGRTAGPYGDELPQNLEASLASGVLWSAYQRLVVGEIEGIEAFLPEAIEFILRPYLGEDEARRAARAAVPTSTSD